MPEYFTDTGCTSSKTSRPADRIEPRKVTTHRFWLEEIADAHHLFSSKLDNCIKPVLVSAGV